jgi:queuosine precursor transporter
MLERRRDSGGIYALSGSEWARRIGFAALALYIGTIWLANYLVANVGLVSVGFGLQAPAGVYCAGAALVLRNVVQRLLGRPISLLAILAGAGLSYWVSPSLATASAAAFLFSETSDFAVYSPLTRQGWTIAATCGAIAGAAVDSAIFLQLAFHDLTFWRGQFVGKMEMALVAVAVWALIERLGVRHTLLVADSGQSGS